MKTIKVKLYELEELSQTAQKEAYYHWLANGYEYFDSEEFKLCLDRFCSDFRLDVNSIDYHVSSDTYSISYGNDVPKSTEYELQGVRLWKYLQNNDYTEALIKACPYTGSWIDEEILNPLRQFMLRPDKRDMLKYIIEECLEQVAYAVHKDMEYQSSEEFFRDMCIGNEWHFTENGMIY